MPDDLTSLRDQLRDFARARDWAPFHSPKNLASALSVEAAELLEHFQWLTEDQSRALGEAQRVEVGHEAADVLLYLIQLAVVGWQPPVVVVPAPGGPPCGTRTTTTTNNNTGASVTRQTTDCPD